MAQNIREETRLRERDGDERDKKGEIKRRQMDIKEEDSYRGNDTCGVSNSRARFPFPENKRRIGERKLRMREER